MRGCPNAVGRRTRLPVCFCLVPVTETFGRCHCKCHVWSVSTDRHKFSWTMSVYSLTIIVVYFHCKRTMLCPSLMSLTTFMPALTRTTRRWPSRLCSLKTTSPSHSHPLAGTLHWVGLLLIRLQALMAFLDVCSGPVMGSWLRPWLTDVTGPNSCPHVLQNHLHCAGAKHSTAESLNDFHPVAFTPPSWHASWG